MSDEEKCALYSPDVRARARRTCPTREHMRARVRSRSTARDPLNRVLEAEFHGIFPDQVLTFVDRLSMAHSLEVRSAFLDTEVVEYVASAARVAEDPRRRDEVHPQAGGRALLSRRDDPAAQGRVPDAGDRVGARRSRSPGSARRSRRSGWRCTASSTRRGWARWSIALYAPGRRLHGRQQGAGAGDLPGVVRDVSRLMAPVR